MAKFHAQMDGLEFHDIYAQSTEEFQKSVSEADIAEFLSAVHCKFGNLQSTKEQLFRESLAPPEPLLPCPMTRNLRMALLSKNLFGV